MESNYTKEQLLKLNEKLKVKVAKLEDSLKNIKETKHTLNNGEDKYQDIIQNLIVGFYRARFDGELLLYNTNFINILGLDVNKNYKGIKLPDFWQNPVDRKVYIDELMSNGFIKNFVINAKKLNGEKIIVQVNSRLVKDNKGKLSIIEGTFLEVTEQKLMEKSMRESEVRFNEAQRLAKIGSWELNLITNTLYWSDEVFRLFNIEPHQFSATYESFLDNIHPDDRELVNSAYTKSLKNKTPYNIVHRLLLKDGTIKYVNEYCETIYDNSDNAVRSIGTIQDITERVSAEKLSQQTKEELQKSKSILSSLINSPENVIMFALDLDYKYLIFNKAHVTEMKNIYDHDIKTGHFILDYMPNEDDRQKALKNYDRVVKGERFIEIQEYGLLDKRFWYELIFNPIFDNTHQVTGLTVFITEITQRKMAEIEIQKERNKLTRIFESMQDGVYIVSKAYEIEYVNPVLIKDFGPPSDKKCHQYFHDSDDPCTFCKSDEVFAGKTVQWEWTSPRNGKTYDLIDSPMKHSDGSISKLEIFRDITGRKETEDKIARYSRIFEDSLNEIYIFNADTLKFTQVNSAAQKNLGYSMEELQKMTPLDFKPEFTVESFSEMVEPLRKGEKQKIVFETVHQRKDKSLYNVEVHLQLMLFEHEKIFAAIIMDITERKFVENALQESEEKLRTTIENINDIVLWQMDEKGIYTYLSPAVINILGYNPGEMEGTPGFAYFKQEDLPLIKKKMAARKKGDQTPTEFEMLAKDGSFIPVELSSSAIKNKNGDVIGFSGIARDITARKKADNELANYHKNLEILVKQRTNELENKNKELDNALKVFVGRELKIRNLENKIKAMIGE